MAMAYPAPPSSSPQKRSQIEIEVESQPSAPYSRVTTDASASASTSTAANPNSNKSWDVFINYRSSDVKYTFASYLHRRLLGHGLKVFLEEQLLQMGDDLTPQIEDAIRTASIHVAILSPHYAASKWCLDELVLMLQSGATIIPVFYGVKPSELRWTRGGTGLYAQALGNFENKGNYEGKPRYDYTKVENWRNALYSVGVISGFELDAYDGDEGELLDVVVERVLKKVKKTLLNVAQYPSGLEEEVEVFERTVMWQHQYSGKPLVVGIVGLGGVGKTTLAKAFFNMSSSYYSRSYFLSEIRENAMKTSLVSLQRELLKGLTGMDVQIDSIHEGISMLINLLSISNVLVILDDVDRVSQLEAFLPLQTVLPSKSLIVITSRNRDVLTSSGVAESAIHNLKGLNVQHSRELFCSYAFNQRHPLPGYESLVENFLMACDGLPLSLKVFGSLLYGKSASYWKDQLDRIKLVPTQIQDTLKNGFDSLDTQEQHIFLDIACFFIGKERDMAIRIWDGSGWKGLRGFQNLQNRYLVEVDSSNLIRMHDLLKDMGRTIADSELPCRLWRERVNNEDLLQQSRLITDVRGMRMLSDDDASEMPLYERCLEVFGNCTMKLCNRPHNILYSIRKLQLLDTEGGLLAQILSRVQSPDLIWLRWYKCPYSSLPSWIPMKNLRVLEVRGNKLESLWQTVSQAPLRLRELDIDSPLSKLPKSIGRLKHLEQIVVKNSNLKTLSEEFCHVRSLKRFELTNCSKLKSLPDSFGYLINLEYINLSNASHLQMLPNSFGNLIRLKYLNLSRCSNLTISSKTLKNISMLECIDLSYCTKIEELPLQLAHQRSLKKLDLKGTHLKEFPSAIGALSKLEVLELGSPLLDRLPPSVGDVNLKELTLSGMQFKCLPEFVGLLTKLTVLKVENCNALVEVGTLPNSLIILGLTDCLQLRKIGLYGLAKLQYLDIRGCKVLQELPNIGTLISLEELRASSCVKLKSIQGLARLTKLRLLDVRECSELEELPGIEHLRSLEYLH